MADIGVKLGWPTVANRGLRLRFHLTEVAMRCKLRRKILSAIDDLQHEPSLV